jgi:hypothetical protein
MAKSLASFRFLLNFFYFNPSFSMSVISTMSDSSSDELFSLFEEPEEFSCIEKALDEVEKLKDELKSSLAFVQQLSAKYLKPPTNYLHSITPEGSSWAKCEYLKWNVDALINEERQKHDSVSPQQHHKVQEINDDSSSPTPLETSEIINHSTEVNEDLEFEGDEDEKSSDQQSFGGIQRSLSEVSIVYSKLRCEKIKLRYQLQSAMTIVNRLRIISKSRAIASQNYAFKASRFVVIIKSKRCLRRTMSSLPSQLKEPLKFDKIVRSASFSI